jgi:hypothetical protein
VSKPTRSVLCEIENQWDEAKLYPSQKKPRINYITMNISKKPILETGLAGWRCCTNDILYWKFQDFVGLQMDSLEIPLSFYMFNSFELIIFCSVHNPGN